VLELVELELELPVFDTEVDPVLLALAEVVAEELPALLEPPAPPLPPAPPVPVALLFPELIAPVLAVPPAPPADVLELDPPLAEEVPPVALLLPLSATLPPVASLLLELLLSIVSPSKMFNGLYTSGKILKK